MNENRNDDSYSGESKDISGFAENTGEGAETADNDSTGSAGSSRTGSSVYSYNYRDEKNQATRGGDYDARRDDLSSQSSSRAGSTGEDSAQTSQNSCVDAGGYTYSQNSQSSCDSVQNNYDSGYQNTYQDQSYGGAQNAGGYRENYNSTAGDQTNYSGTGTGFSEKKSKAKKNRTHMTRTRRSGAGFWQKKNFGVGLLKCAVFAVVFGLIAGGIFYGISGLSGGNDSGTTAVTTTSSSETSTTSVSTASTVTDVSDIVAEVMPAIVSITNVSETEYYSMFGSESETYESESAGSGIIVAEDDDYLYIATNNHVVDGYTYLTITFYDESTASADVKGTAASSDLAVVSVDKSTLEDTTLSAIKIATLGDSTTLEVGEGAIAIGNALGYGQSVTTGVISALDREVTTTDSSTGISVTNSLIQTDAAINPGNSGGALLNMQGEVIGINSVKYSDTDVEGMGYAIPISTAQPIIDDLISQEKVDESKSAYLGISGVDLDSDTASTYGMPQGVYVVQVAEGSAAETAGIQSGDIITGFDDYTISSMEELQERMSYYEAGTDVVVTVQRNTNGSYEEVEIAVTLGSKN